MESKKNKAEKIRVVKKYAETFKKHVVSEVEAGVMTAMEASREYSVPRQTISDWLEKYGTMKTQFVEIVMKDQKDKIQELKSELADAYLKLKYYECLISEAGKECGFDVKKNSSTGELELVNSKTGEVLRGCVK